MEESFTNYLKRIGTGNRTDVEIIGEESGYIREIHSLYISLADIDRFYPGDSNYSLIDISIKTADNYKYYIAKAVKLVSNSSFYIEKTITLKGTDTLCISKYTDIEDLTNGDEHTIDVVCSSVTIPQS